jgi:hypothetical protein
VERVFKVKEGRPNVVDLIKGDRIQLIVNTPRGQDTFFDEKAIRRAAVLARIPTITTIAAAQAAAEGIAAMQNDTAWRASDGAFRRLISSVCINVSIDRTPAPILTRF